VPSQRNQSKKNQEVKPVVNQEVLKPRYNVG